MSSARQTKLDLERDTGAESRSTLAKAGTMKMVQIISRAEEGKMNTSKLPVAETITDVSTVDTMSDAVELCSTCQHPWRDHDALGARFCAATASAGLARGCICR
jgi:hypothetical protein